MEVYSLDCIQLSSIILLFSSHWEVLLTTRIMLKLLQMAKLVRYLDCQLLIVITFLNTSTVIGIKPLCTSVALMDNCFRRFAEVEVSESWSHGHQTWTAIGNIDT